MIREEKIEFTTKWCKYSKYVIEKKDDKYYILPDKNAKPSTYDPFEIKNQILKDLLVIGKESVDNEMFKLVNKEVSIEALSKIEKFCLEQSKRKQHNQKQIRRFDDRDKK